MSTLFDTSPLEPADKPKVRARVPNARARVRVGPPISETPPEKGHSFLGQISVGPPLGRLDDVVVCIDQTCQAAAMDIWEEDGWQWYVECSFCGTGQWVRAIRGHLKPREREFVFNDGRFAGRTVAQAFAMPRGQDYVEWAAKSHQREAVRAACQKHLDSLRPAE